MEALAATNDNLPTAETLNWPKHIAVIMDGNHRWARARKLPSKVGHRQGAEALKKLVEHCADTGLECLTVYAFSSENWQRPEEEINDLMSLMRYYLRNEVKHLHKHNVRVAFIGERQRMSEDLRAEMERAEQLTAGNSRMTLIVAFSYGAREELVRSAKQLAARVESGELRADAVSEADIFGGLDTTAWPDPDLLIRTGGEKRLSNFLLWQAAYSELYFCDTLWPDFTIDDMTKAVEDYAQRERRFGGRTE